MAAVLGTIGCIARAQEREVGAAPTVTSSITQDLRYSGWTGTRGTNIFDSARGKGGQLYAPSLGTTVVEWANVAKWEVAAKTGYVWSSHDTKGQEASYNGPIDSQVSASVTLGGVPYFKPVLGVAVNIPTGQTIFPGQQRFIRMDPDLVEIGAYGEGFNVTPSIGVTFAPSANFVLTPSVGYSWRGAFDREAPGSNIFAVKYDARQSIDPGDVLTASLSGTAKIGAWAVQGTAAYTAESDVRQDGIAIARKGPGVVANLAALWPVTERMNILFNTSYAYYGKNRVLGPTGSLIDEADNSNSHLIIGSFAPSYNLTEQLRVGLNYSLLFRDHNYYDILHEQYIPARIKHSFGPTLDYAFTNTATLSFTAARFWMKQDTGPHLLTLTRTSPLPVESFFADLPPELNYTGWTSTVALRVQF